ncbi:cob(I)yrinic acid a,c-diamide adenosyltransferase, partial [bacterium]|nr:cob(I)yrinic acid a,c-diamide adenosyltransferase [bacterium]
RYKLTEKLKKKVQLITEMKNIKHPYPEIGARKGIEF